MIVGHALVPALLAARGADDAKVWVHGGEAPELERIDTLVAAMPDTVPPESATLADPALLIYTSGRRACPRPRMSATTAS